MKKCCLLLLSALMLAGCWDAIEPERMYYAHGIGVDYVDGQFEVYVQIIDFTNIAKSEQPQPDAPQSEVGYARGKTINEAIFNLYHMLDMRLYWGHLTFVVFSKSILEEGKANTVVNALIRYRETRYQIWMYATEEKITDVLLATPILNKAISLSSLAAPTNPFDQESDVPPVNLRQYILHLNEPTYTVDIPYIKLKENWESEKGKKKRIDYKGIAVLSQTELKGLFTSEEVIGTQFMTNETKRTQVTYSLKDKPLSVGIEDVKVDVKSKPVEDSFHFDVTVKFNAILSEFRTEVTEKEIEESIKKEVEEKIRETYHKALEKDIDIYRLSNYAYKQHVKKWKIAEKNGQVPLDEDSISSIKVYIEQLSPARKEFSETIKSN
jgi:spore germination protein KC